MPIAIGDKVYEDEVHYNAAALGIELPKEDTTSTTPSTPSEKPADALKMQEGTQVPAEVNASPERSILGQLTGSDGQERYQTFPERMVRGAISAMALPGDVLSGKVQPGSPQEIERAMDLAGLMVGGPAPVAAKMADGTLGSFAGVTSKTLDKNKLAEAQIMKHNGASADDIWQKTGFFKGADDRWKFEIPDQNATLKDTAFEKNFIPSDPRTGGEANTTVTLKGRRALPENATPEEMTNYFNQKPLRLSEVLDHPELFKAYPHLNDLQVSQLPKFAEDRGLIGQMDSHNGILYLKGDLHPSFAKSVILHEVQHSIQEAEGFAKGGNSGQFMHPNLDKAQKIYDDAVKAGGDPKSPALVKAKAILDAERRDAQDKYIRLMGEVEARNVQARMNYSDRTRKYTHPEITEKIPREQQIDNRVAGVSNSEIERTVPKDNYRTDLSKYTDKLYRETSPEEALNHIPLEPTHSSSMYDKTYYADHPDMATGQGNNKGVKLTYDSKGFEGQINTSKPMWEPAFKQGFGEYLAQPMIDPKKAVKSIEIDMNAFKNSPKWVPSRYRMVVERLRKAGWDYSKDGSKITLKAPE